YSVSCDGCDPDCISDIIQFGAKYNYESHIKNSIRQSYCDLIPECWFPRIKTFIKKLDYIEVEWNQVEFIPLHYCPDLTESEFNSLPMSSELSEYTGATKKCTSQTPRVLRVMEEQKSQRKCKKSKV
ncbi:hypothetical protein AKO1_003183, partial [Acrasis kona]